jgi:DNA-binding CsgD family transcriptional regulator
MSEIRPCVDPASGDDLQVQDEEVELQEERPEPSQTPGDIPAPVRITKLQPRKDRTELRYDYRGGKSSREVRFSDLRFNSDVYKTPDDYLGHVMYELERKGGSEYEQSRFESQAEETLLEESAEATHLQPALDSAPTACTNCGETIPNETKRFVIFRAELPHVGKEISSIDWMSVQCTKCEAGSNAWSRSRSRNSDQSWLAELSSDEYYAWTRKKEGLNQREISAQMGKTQPTVSRLLKRVDHKRRQALIARLRSTGGA